MSNQSRLKIGLDFDDTLMQTREALVNLLNSLHNTNIRIEDCEDYYLSHPWAVTEEKFHTLFETHQDHIHTQPPLEGLLETLALWSPHAAFTVITGRPDIWLPSASNWLAKHNIPIDTIIAAGPAGGKGVIAKKLNLDFFIEDHAQFATEIANANIPVYLLDRPYNQNLTHPNITRVKDWHEIRQLALNRFPLPSSNVLNHLTT